MILRDLDLLAKRFSPPAGYWSVVTRSFEDGGRSAAVGRNPKQDSPCPPRLSDFNTERTEHLRELRVEILLATDDTARHSRNQKSRMRKSSQENKVPETSGTAGGRGQLP